MSIEISLYPLHASKEQLVRFLKTRGYKPCQHFWNWPKGTVNLYWFNGSDFTSFDGVEASVFPPTAEQQAEYGSCERAIHTRTRASASSGDLHEQNETIRSARRQFKGVFYNDWYGKNRYTEVDLNDRTPLTRGLYIVRERTVQSLQAVKYGIPEPIMKNLEGTRLASLAQSDPSRILYNALVPFAVAA